MKIPSAMSKQVPRTALVVLIGIIWGSALGVFSLSGDTTGFFLLVLFGPPLVLLISPEHPLLGWQTPIVAGVVVGTILSRNRGDTGSGGPADTPGSLLVTGLMMWVVCTFFSSPWALIFQRRSQRIREGRTAGTGAMLSYVGVGLMVFVACALLFAGYALTTRSLGSSDPSDLSVPFIGFLIATAGVALSVGSYWVGEKLGVREPVRKVVEMVMAFFAFGPLIIAAIGLVLDFLPFSRYKSIEPHSISLPAGWIWFVLAVLEALAAMIWITRTNKRLAKPAPGS